MLVCLSSGARNRYLEDIVRSLALPEGAALQFRYDQSLIHPQTMARLKWVGQLAAKMENIAERHCAPGERAYNPFGPDPQASCEGDGHPTAHLLRACPVFKAG